MKKTNWFLLVVVGLLLLSCSDDNNPTSTIINQYNSDNQIRIQMTPGYGIGTSSAIPYMLQAENGIIKFNIDNYAGVDSVTLVALIKTSSSSVNCFVGLYNLTDSTYFKKSQVQTTSSNEVWLESKNIISELPKKEITIIPYIKSEMQGVLVNASRMYLFLYRKK